MDTEDGVTFRPDTAQAPEIRREANYAGECVTLLGLIDGARRPVQIDIGFGDAVTPGPEEVPYPVMLPDFQAPKLRACKLKRADSVRKSSYRCRKPKSICSLHDMCVIVTKYELACTADSTCIFTSTMPTSSLEPNKKNEALSAHFWLWFYVLQCS